MDVAIETLLDEIEEHEDRLSQRDREFIDDIQMNVLGEGRNLSERQLEWVKNIHSKVVP